jgi:hypothetical protein
MAITTMNAITPTLDGFGCGSTASCEPDAAIGGDDPDEGATWAGGIAGGSGSGTGGAAICGGGCGGS